MVDNPYRIEIVLTAILAPSLVAVETWRRWGQWLRPEALDDTILGGMALFLFVLSSWGSIFGYADGDPSGAPMPAVIAFKLTGVALLSVFSRRALRRVRLADPYQLNRRKSRGAI